MLMPACVGLLAPVFPVAWPDRGSLFGVVFGSGFAASQNKTGQRGPSGFGEEWDLGW